MKLYSRWRNTAGERVRIALNLKDLAYEYIPASSLPEGAYRTLNPQGLLPALEVDGRVIAQSSAILEYLEETHPNPPLLPSDPILRAQARAFGAHVAAEMHAIAVTRVRKFLAGELSVDEAGVGRWVRHWQTTGFVALESALAARETDWPFCFGDTPGWADLHLVPQLGVARRYDLDLSPYPRLLAVEANCVVLPAFQAAHPDAQPDRPPGR